MALEEFRSSPDVRTGVVQGNTFSNRPVQYSVIDGQAIFEGDIVLGTVEGMEQLAADVIPDAVVIPGAQFRWPEGVVPFTIDPALPNVARVNDAIAHWHNRTQIRLVAHTTQQNFVTFRPGNGCSSPVGMRGGQQFITLAPGCDRGAVIHEIGHTVGLWHEQSREDRDQFIRIHFENIEPGREHNFNQHITDGDDIGPYDFGSIMHYDAFAFSRNDQLTIETLHGEAIGQRNGLSDGDVQAVRFMYPGTLRVAANPQDKWVLTMGNRVLVITNDGNVFAHDTTGNTIGIPFQLGAGVAANPQDKRVLVMGNRILVNTNDGGVFVHDITGNTIGVPFRLAGPPVAANPQDKWVLTMGNRVLVITNDGNVFAHDITGNTIGIPFQLS